MVNPGDVVPLSHLPVRTPDVVGIIQPKKRDCNLVVIFAGEAARDASLEAIGQVAVDLLYANGWTHPEHAPSAREGGERSALRPSVCPACGSDDVTWAGGLGGTHRLRCNTCADARGSA